MRRAAAPKAIVLVGPTAVGKTDLSLEIAEKFSCEIISVDSMQVYRYMDVGTAKPSRLERKRIPHHLIDIVDPDEDFTVADFIKDAAQAIAQISGRGYLPLLVGGTGLYLKGLQEGLFEIAPIDLRFRKDLRKRLQEEGRQRLYAELRSHDPLAAKKIHPNDTQRLLRALEIFYSTGTPWSEHTANQKVGGPLRNALKLGLTCDRKLLYEKINLRVESMVRQGLRDEVQTLLDKGYGSNLKSMQSIGYRHMINYLAGKWSWERTIELLARDTRHYAKRQYTWFRRDPEINWFHPTQQKEEIFQFIHQALKGA